MSDLTEKAMTGFTIFYGCVYLVVGVGVYGWREPQLAWWCAALAGLLAVIALHGGLALLGHVSMKRHQR